MHHKQGRYAKFLSWQPHTYINMRGKHNTKMSLPWWFIFYKGIIKSVKCSENIYTVDELNLISLSITQIITISLNTKYIEWSRIGLYRNWFYTIYYTWTILNPLNYISITVQTMYIDILASLICITVKTIYFDIFESNGHHGYPLPCLDTIFFTFPYHQYHFGITQISLFWFADATLKNKKFYQCHNEVIVEACAYSPVSLTFCNLCWSKLSRN